MSSQSFDCAYVIAEPSMVAADGRPASLAFCSWKKEPPQAVVVLLSLIVAVNTAIWRHEYKVQT